MIEIKEKTNEIRESKGLKFILRTFKTEVNAWLNTESDLKTWVVWKHATATVPITILSLVIELKSVYFLIYNSIYKSWHSFLKQTQKTEIKKYINVVTLIALNLFKKIELEKDFKLVHQGLTLLLTYNTR